MLALKPRIDFSLVSPTGLPGGVTVRTFEDQKYHWTEEATQSLDGEVEISELLVRLQDPAGNRVDNKSYFEQVHDAELGPDVDAKLVSQAIRYAHAHDMIGKNKTIAVNVFQASLTPQLFDQIQETLEELELNPQDLLIELLEYQTPISAEQIETVAVARELGFHFALDDVDPRDPHDRERVAAFGPYCDILKLRREVMRDVRNEVYEAGQFLEDLETMAGAEELFILAEGVPLSHHHTLPHFVHATQSRWAPLREVK